MTSTEIYQQSIDKQRIIVIGGGSGLIASLIVHALRLNNRRFDYVNGGKTESLKKDSPIIINANEVQPIEYKHHIVVFGNNASEADLALFEKLANATPKSGTIIYPKANSILSKICAQERMDVQAIPYEVYNHEVANGKTLLITSTSERFPIQLHGNLDLQGVSAAKEVLKKIGISSGQFYKAISQYKPA